MLDFIIRYNKRFTLTVGFLFGVLGTSWSYFYVDSTNREIEALGTAKADAVKQAQGLSQAAYDYFLANQQGDLIFVMSLQASARMDLVKLIYQSNMLDRATPVRNMIGALALAGQVDYRSTYDTYAAMNDKAREDVDFTLYSKVKAHESDIIKQGEAFANTVWQRIAAIDATRTDLDARNRKQRLYGIMFAMIGNFILLCANLIGEKKPRSEAT